MSHFLIKQVQDTLITAPESNYIKLFSNINDNGSLYYVGSNGVPTSVSSTTIPVTPTTYSDLYDLSLVNGFATGSNYLITDFDSVYEQPDFYFDGTPKTRVSIKGKPSGFPYQPLLVTAVSSNTLSPDAYQPPFDAFNGYPKDKIKYDLTWNTTEFDRSCKGRITERIDEYGNRTDYDHRTIRFKRYQDYTRNHGLDGVIVAYDCTSGDVKGHHTLFTELEKGSVILLDTKSVLGYNIGLKILGVSNDTSMTVCVDSLYGGSRAIPGEVTLKNGSIISPVDYGFTEQSFRFYSSNETGIYNQVNEVYFSQSDFEDFDDEIYTFQFDYEITNIGYVYSINNYLGNYSTSWVSGQYFILPNNVFGHQSTSNKLGDYSFNNNFGNKFAGNSIGLLCRDNIVSSGNMNTIGNYFQGNNISGTFSNNFIGDTFTGNTIDAFQYNNTYVEVLGTDFTLATHVAANYNCNIIRNSGGDVKLTYIDDIPSINANDIWV